MATAGHGFGDVFELVGDAACVGHAAHPGVDAAIEILDDLQRTAAVDARGRIVAEGELFEIGQSITIRILGGTILTAERIDVLPGGKRGGLDLDDRDVVVDHKRITRSEVKGEVVGVASGAEVGQVAGIASIFARAQ